MAPGRSWPARDVPRSALGRHLGAQRPSRACPDACPTRPGATTTAQDRYFVDLGCMFVDFRTIFRRFSFEPLATKAQIQNLKKESRDPHRTSWLLRYAVALYCSYFFRNYLRTLHVQPFFVAYPQAHLYIYIYIYIIKKNPPVRVMGLG